ncbi:MAG TPA: hypothetical protein VN874_02645 [Myxococcales bacterium]|nr:hypothetical protein [Myxococcales bacterium]
MLVEDDVAAEGESGAGLLRALEPFDHQRVEARAHLAVGVRGEVGADEHDAVLRHQPQGLERGAVAVLDRGDKALGRDAGPLVGRAVGRDLDVRERSLLDQVAHLVGGVEVALVVDHDLDHLRAEEDVLANGLLHLVARVRVEILGLAQVGPLRREPIELAAQRPDDPARVDDGGAGHEPLLDRVAQIGVGIVAGVADVAHGGEARFEHLARVARADQRAVSRRVERGGGEQVA